MVKTTIETVINLAKDAVAAADAHRVQDTHDSAQGLEEVGSVLADALAELGREDLSRAVDVAVKAPADKQSLPTLLSLTWEIGDRVEGGDNLADYDCGEIVAVEFGRRVEVAWDGGMRVWVGADGVRREGERPFRIRAEDVAIRATFRSEQQRTPALNDLLAVLVELTFPGIPERKIQGYVTLARNTNTDRFEAWGALDNWLSSGMLLEIHRLMTGEESIELFGGIERAAREAQR